MHGAIDAHLGFYFCDKCVETCEQIIAELKKYYENLDRKNGRVHTQAAES